MAMIAAIVWCAWGLLVSLALLVLLGLAWLADRLIRASGHAIRAARRFRNGR